jgi:4-hydroxy-3-methylbut-2-en-1-yl diphosphate reductase
MKDHYKLDESQIGERFADTRDTLCYATNDNQSAVSALLDTPAHLAIVAGGYNSSNTTHLVEMCEDVLPVYFVNSPDKIISRSDILHYNYHTKEEILTSGYLPDKKPVNVIITSGASCPDAVVEEIIRKLSGFFDAEEKLEQYVL